MTGNVLCVLREPLFSPGKEKADETILCLAADWLTSRGMDVEILSAETLVERWQGEGDEVPAELILSMAQGEGPIKILSRWESQGALVLNRPGVVYECSRRERFLRCLQGPEGKGNVRGESPQGGFHLPRSEIVDTEGGEEAVAGWTFPLWVKRADHHSLEPGDVVLAKGPEGAREALFALSSRRVQRALLQEHIEGEVIKFYGVGGGRFWRWRGVAQTTCPPSYGEVVQGPGLEASRRLGLDIYGGDVILTPEGEVWLIDLNDWPSFTGCQADASDAIAGFALEGLRKKRLVQN